MRIAALGLVVMAAIGAPGSGHAQIYHQWSDGSVTVDTPQGRFDMGTGLPAPYPGGYGMPHRQPPPYAGGGWNPPPIAGEAPFGSQRGWGGSQAPIYGEPPPRRPHFNPLDGQQQRERFEGVMRDRRNTFIR